MRTSAVHRAVADLLRRHRRCAGKQDVTPRGDPPGSFKVIDEHTIAIADRPGNNRLDTLKNLLENPEIALIFLMPGTNETARLAGTARLSVDPELLASMAVQGKAPKCAIVVSVRQAYFHCAKALLRSKLWTGDYAQPKGTFPSITRMVGDQIGLSEEEKKKREARTETAYRDGLWAPINVTGQRARQMRVVPAEVLKRLYARSDRPGCAQTGGASRAAGRRRLAGARDPRHLVGRAGAAAAGRSSSTRCSGRCTSWCITARSRRAGSPTCWPSSPARRS